MIINGTDYTLYIIRALSVIGIAALEYLICLKSKKKANRQVLLFIPFFILVAALVIYGSETNGSFLDLRAATTAMLTVWALLCAVGQFIGWFSYKLKYENEKDEIPRDCPMAKQ